MFINPLECKVIYCLQNDHNIVLNKDNMIFYYENLFMPDKDRFKVFTRYLNQPIRPSIYFKSRTLDCLDYESSLKYKNIWNKTCFNEIPFPIAFYVISKNNDIEKRYYPCVLFKNENDAMMFKLKFC